MPTANPEPFLAHRPPPTRLRALLGIFLTLAACDTLGNPQPPPGPVLVVETDLRKPQRADSPPPPVQGGSLLALKDGSLAVVGDPDRQRLLIVSLSAGRVVHTLHLAEGARPGRLTEDNSRQVHVLLRGTHQLLTLNPEAGEVTRRLDVCVEPRGIAYQPADDTLLLACADGNLWRYANDSGEALTHFFVARDLRDVVVTAQGAVLVSSFRSARVFRVASDGAISTMGSLPDATRFIDSLEGSVDRPMTPRAAWRMVAVPSGVALVHQRAATDEIDIKPHDTSEQSADGGTLRRPVGDGSAGNAYGGGTVGAMDGIDQQNLSGCDSIVHSAVSVMDMQGEVRSTGALADAILPVDIAASSDGGLLAVVSAGARDKQAPRPKIVFPEVDNSSHTLPPSVCDGCQPVQGAVQLLTAEANGQVHPGPDFSECASGSALPIQEPAISVAFVGSTSRVLVQTRQPAKLYLADARTADIERVIDLGGNSVADTGHELFHRDSGGGIACASCHLEGTDDGHIWRFSDVGPRRTLPLNVRLRGTQPFHWDGNLQDLGALMNEVFVGRMGGAPQSQTRLDVLGDWVLDLPPWAPMRDGEDPAALRGKALFESSEVGCSTCHSGAKLTNNQSVDVGTSDGVPLQVPSLLGVGYRSPLMHSGCAKNLAERFAPRCGGGDRHGRTSQLSESQIADLIAYLETL